VVYAQRPGVGLTPREGDAGAAVTEQLELSDVSMRDQTTADTISLDTLIVRSEGYLSAEVDNEVAMLNIEKGTCYGLNKVGSRIWNLIEAPMSVNDLCAKLVAEFDVEPQICERQVLDLLEELRAEGLIAPASGR